MRSMVFVTGAIVLQVAALLAQRSPSPPNEPAHKVYVLTGCLERGSASTSVFQLADSTPVGQAPPADPSNADAADEARSYGLLPVSTVSEQGINRETLESHVGSRVEVTVRPGEPSSPVADNEHVEDHGAKGRAIYAAPVHGRQDQQGSRVVSA